MVVDNGHFLVDLYAAVVHFSDSDPAYIFVIIDRADQYLRSGFRVAFRGRNIVQNRFKEGGHVLSPGIHIQGSNPCFGRSEDERAVQLLFTGIQIDKQFQHFINNFPWPCLRAVDFIDAYDNGKLQFQSLAQNEFCLRHSAFKGVHDENNAVYHFQDALHLAAEIGMARSIDNIDFGIFINNGSVFGQNGNPPFPFDIVGVHNTFRNFLIFTENAALFQQFVHQCSLAVVNVGDNSNVSYVFSGLFHK